MLIWLQKFRPVRPGWYAYCGTCGRIWRRKSTDQADHRLKAHLGNWRAWHGYIVHVTQPESFIWAAASLAGHGVPLPDYLRARSEHLEAEDLPAVLVGAENGR